jgi:hypothetical protein
MSKLGANTKRAFDLKFCFEYFGVPLETEAEEEEEEEKEKKKREELEKAEAEQQGGGAAKEGQKEKSSMQQKLFDYKQEAATAKERSKKQRAQRRRVKQRKEDEDRQAQAIKLQQQLLHEQLSKRLKSEAAIGLSKYREYAQHVAVQVTANSRKRSSLVKLQVRPCRCMHAILRICLPRRRVFLHRLSCVLIFSAPSLPGQIGWRPQRRDERRCARAPGDEEPPYLRPDQGHA